MSTNVIVKRILDRLHVQNKNYLGVFVGSTGSGKSMASLKIASEIDPNFSSKQICFSIEEFLEILNTGNLKRGSVIVLEETGISASNRNWQSLQNKAISYVFQSFRFLGIGVILNLPSITFLDTHVRSLVHQLFETVSIDYQNNTCKCRVFDVQQNAVSGKIYMKFPRAIINNELVTIESMNFNLPPVSLIAPYDELKAAFVSSLNVDLLKGIQEQKIDRTNKTLDIEPIVESIMSDIGSYVRKYGGENRVPSSLIMAKHNLGSVSANKVKAAVEFRLKNEVL